MNSAAHPTEQEEIMAYLDGELAPDRAALVAAHLRECPDCESLAAGLRGVSRQLMAWTVEASPAALNQRVAEAVAWYSDAAKTPGLPPKPGTPFRWFGSRRLILATAGACVLLLIIAIVRTSNLLRSRIAAEQAVEIGRQRAAAAGKGYKGWLDKNSSTDRALNGAADSLTTLNSPGVAADSDGLYHGRGDHAQSTYSADGQPSPDQPLIARTASLTLVVKDFAPIEASVKAIAARHNGYIADLNTESPENAGHKFSATLRIPAPQLEAALAELKQLGRVEQATQSGEDVTKRFTDVAAQLKNSRITEQRLLDVLRDRTGKMKDILETEQEIERVRGEIETMEAEQRGLQKRIDFATVQLSVTENYKASLEVAPPSTGTQFHNAAVAGFRTVIDGSIGFALWLLEAGPSLLLWAAILFFPVRWAWRRWRHELFGQASAATSK